jgi:prepilin-type processing-associated H-X9-DG protein
MKQMGLALVQYTQDYDETLPFVDMGPGSAAACQFSDGKILWADVIQPYTKSLQLFRCSSNSTTNTPLGTSLPAPLDTNMSYAAAVGGTNAFDGAFSLIYYDFGSGLVPPTKLASFTTVSETIAVAEPVDGALYGYQAIGRRAPGDGIPSKIHLDGSNLLFVDGHVKWLLPEKTYANNHYLWLRVKP